DRLRLAGYGDPARRAPDATRFPRRLRGQALSGSPDRVQPLSSDSRSAESAPPGCERELGGAETARAVERADGPRRYGDARTAAERGGRGRSGGGTALSSARGTGRGAPAVPMLARRRADAGAVSRSPRAASGRGDPSRGDAQRAPSRRSRDRGRRPRPPELWLPRTPAVDGADAAARRGGAGGGSGGEPAGALAGRCLVG